MRTSNVSYEEQYRLIMECRSSGLTDYQWCLEHDIKPGTFYNWVKRLRKSGCTDIPAAVRRRKSDRQDVVRIEFGNPTEICNPAIPTAPVVSEQKASIPAVIEVIMSDRVIRISNDADPFLLEQKYCADCGSEMTIIGKEFVRREFRFTPAKGESSIITVKQPNVRSVQMHQFLKKTFIL